jgi:hypothetical protein
MPSPAPDKATEQEVRRLLKRLARAKGDWPSEPALRDLSPQMVEALLWRVEQQHRANSFRRIINCVLLILSICLLHSRMYGIYGDTLATGVLIGTLMRAYLEPGKKYSVYALTQTGDIRVLPTLIKATNNEWACHPQVIGAICRLLKQGTEADAGLLTQEVQNTLWFIGIEQTWQEVEYDEALAWSALQAFVHVGSREILARMRKIVRDPNRYPASQHIITLIEQLIPVTEERLQRQEVPQTLLRASDATVALPDTLLRAVHATPAEPTVQLLRASTSETPADER